MAKSIQQWQKEEYKRNRQSECEVLKHLENIGGNENFHTLCLKFDQNRSDTIGPDLDHMIDDGLLERRDGARVCLTDLGRARLEMCKKNLYGAF